MISVVVPAYNASRYLEECLSSILAQTYRDIEVIVVDDGSTDNTAEITKKIAQRDARVRLISQENGGPSRARNRGIAEAKGDVLTFVDSDDMIHPEFLETMLRLQKESGAEISIAMYHRSKECKWDYDKSLDYETLDSEEAISRSLYQVCSMDSTPCAKLAPTRFYRLAPFREGIIYEDLDQFYKLYQQAEKVAVTQKKLYFYRDNPVSCINTFRPARWNAIVVTELMEQHFAHNATLLNAAKARRFAANFNIFILGTLHSEVGKRMDLEKCWRLVRQYRKGILTNPKTRIKDKAGAAVSFLGKRATIAIAKFIY